MAGPAIRRFPAYGSPPTGAAWSCTRWGLPCPLCHQKRRCALTAPFHRYLCPSIRHRRTWGHRQSDFCGTFPSPNSIGTGGCYPPPCPAVFGLSSRPPIARRTRGRHDAPWHHITIRSLINRRPDQLPPVWVFYAYQHRLSSTKRQARWRRVQDRVCGGDGYYILNVARAYETTKTIPLSSLEGLGEGGALRTSLHCRFSLHPTRLPGKIGKSGFLRLTTPRATDGSDDDRWLRDGVRGGGPIDRKGRPRRLADSPTRQPAKRMQPTGTPAVGIVSRRPGTESVRPTIPP